KDSTGICFIGERPFREFLASFIPATSGPIRTLDGEVIGEHQGLLYYTPGQRHGLGIGGQRDSSGEPWYVAARDWKNNALIVVQGDHEVLYSDHVAATAATWIGAPPELFRRRGALPCMAKIRYRQQDQSCLLRKTGAEQLEIFFELRQRAVAPGQYAVFYDGDRCLGGAVIDRVLSSSDALRAVV
ncbi:MAG: aminomethyltransferase beta-barrel domain-containing protein, partial [Woeseiaceae bacterium]